MEPEESMVSGNPTASKGKERVPPGKCVPLYRGRKRQLSPESLSGKLTSTMCMQLGNRILLEELTWANLHLVCLKIWLERATYSCLVASAICQQNHKVNCG